MLSIQQFMELFPDDQACRDYLFKRRWPRGFICPKCGSNHYSYIRTRHLFECSACKTQTSITSGTVMHRTRLPLSYWMFAFHWFASGEQLSARKLSILLQLQYRTGLRLLQAVREAVLRVNQENHSFVYWESENAGEHEHISLIKRKTHDRANKFISNCYRHVSATHRTKYYHEFSFRIRNGHNRGQALERLIKVGSSSFSVRHEYKIG